MPANQTEQEEEEEEAEEEEGGNRSNERQRERKRQVRWDMDRQFERCNLGARKERNGKKNSGGREEEGKQSFKDTDKVIEQIRHSTSPPARASDSQITSSTTP